MAKDRYSREVADRICALMAAGQSVETICNAPGMPNARTVRGWVERDRDGFAARYKAVTRCKWRESQYSEALAEWIFDELAKGRPLRHICQAEGLPAHSTVLRWAQRNTNGFAADYRLARELGYHAMLDEMMEIADDDSGDWRVGPGGQRVPNRSNIARTRQRLAVRRYLLAQAMPRTGERLIDQGAVRRSDPPAEGVEEVAEREAELERKG